MTLKHYLFEKISFLKDLFSDASLGSSLLTNFFI